MSNTYAPTSGLNQVRAIVIQTLQGAGLTAMAAYDGSAKAYQRAVASVDVAQAVGKPAAMGSYLGQVYDQEAGTVRELYGRQLDVTISIEVRASVAADCEDGCERAADALLSGGLPSGLRIAEQSWEAVSWDSVNQMFLRKGAVKSRAFFTAEIDPESGTLLDFILKGVLIS